MVVLITLAVWAGLALVTAGLFVALIRGGGGTDLPDTEPDAPAVPLALPEQRVVSAEAARTLSSTDAG